MAKKENKNDGLTKKERIKYGFLNFITFGSLKRKAIAKNKQEKTIQTIAGFDLNSFYGCLGDKANYISSKLLSENSLQITLKYTEQVKIDELKNYCDATGVMKSNNTITLLTKSARFIFDSLNVNNEQNKQEN